MSDRNPNPDDRSDNVEKLQANIQHTIQNLREAEAYQWKQLLTNRRNKYDKRMRKEENH